jgi:hypothetical protein
MKIDIRTRINDFEPPEDRQVLEVETKQTNTNQVGMYCSKISIVIPVDPDLSGEEPESIIQRRIWIPASAGMTVQ